jgi:hypothetical protein
MRRFNRAQRLCAIAMTTGINLPLDNWELLNRVAFQRAKHRGGRPSVSGLLARQDVRSCLRREQKFQRRRNLFAAFNHVGKNLEGN